MIRHGTDIVDKARELRKQSLSFQEIGRKLGLSSSTVRNWCFDLGIEKHESLRLNNEIRRKRIKDQDIDLVPDLLSITSEQARFYSAILYGCEGAKYPSTNNVSFVNSDPGLVKTFTRLLRKGFNLNEKKFRIYLQLHDSQDLKEAYKFWSQLLDIPEKQFMKPTITSPRGKMRRQNYQGTCTLRYPDFTLQLRLLGMFEKFCGSGGWAGR